MAVEEYEKACSIKATVLGEDDRSVAELYYKIAIALELCDQPEKAANQVRQALGILRGRSQVITKQLASTESPSERDKLGMELEDLRSLFPDLEAKVRGMDFQV